MSYAPKMRSKYKPHLYMSAGRWEILQHKPATMWDEATYKRVIKLKHKALILNSNLLSRNYSVR